MDMVGHLVLTDAPGRPPYTTRTGVLGITEVHLNDWASFLADTGLDVDRS